MTTSPAQFVLAQYLSQCSSRDAGNQEKSGSKKSLWLQKKNKIRPNDNPSANMATASALDVHRNLVEDCLGKEYLEEPSVDKERAVDRTRPDRDKSRVIKTRINVMDRNRLLLLQLEQSMKRPQNRLRPLPTLKALPEMNDGAQKPSAKKRTSQSGGVKTKRRKTSRDCKQGKREVNKRPNDDKPSEGEIQGDESNLPVTCEERRLYQKGDVIFPKCNPEITVTGAKPEVDDGRESSTQCSSKSSDGGSNSKPLLQSDKEDSQRRDIWIISGDTMATVIPTQQSGAATSRKLFPVGFGKSSSLRGLNCSSNMKDELKVTVMLFIILTSFIVCWAPIAVVNFMETIQSSQVSSWMNKFSVFMMFFSSLINPITYGVLNRNFRREFYHLCSLGCASEQPRSGGETDHRAKHRVFTI